MIKFDNGEYQIPEEYIKIIEKGNAYAQFFDSPAYKIVCDFLEKRADVKLGYLRDSMSSDTGLNNNLRLMWKEAESTLKDLQIEIQSTIELRRQIVSEIDSSTLGQTIETIDF